MNVEDPKYAVVENGNVRQLQVTNVSAADEGFYSCRVQNKHSTAKLLVARTCLYMCSSNSINIYDATIRRQLFTPSETNRIRSNALFKTAGFYLACSSHFLPLPLLAGTVFAVFCLFVCLFVNANVLGRFHEILEVVRL